MSTKRSWRTMDIFPITQNKKAKKPTVLCHRLCKRGSLGGQPPCRLIPLAELAAGQTIQTHSLLGCHLHKGLGCTGHNANSNTKSSSSNYSTLSSCPQTKLPSMTPLMCLRPVAATLSNQIGAGFGSLLARDTLTESTQSCGDAFCMAACWVWHMRFTFAGLTQSRHAALFFPFLSSGTWEMSIIRRQSTDRDTELT